MLPWPVTCGKSEASLAIGECLCIGRSDSGEHAAMQEDGIYNAVNNSSSWMSFQQLKQRLHQIAVIGQTMVAPVLTPRMGER